MSKKKNKKVTVEVKETKNEEEVQKVKKFKITKKKIAIIGSAIGAVIVGAIALACRKPKEDSYDGEYNSCDEDGNENEENTFVVESTDTETE